MAINFDVAKITNDLKDFKIDLESVDTDKIKEKTLKRAAKEMAEMVRLAVVAEDKITSPARLNSKYEHGPGPSLARRPAWRVRQEGNKWVVKPNKKVKQRAKTLNFGVPGTIEPDGDSPMPIEIEGTPIYRWSVEGPDETGYWQAAVNKFEKSGRLEEIAGEEIRAEFEEKGL